MHISSTNKDKIDELVIKVLDYIWKKTHAEEIRVALRHQNIEIEKDGEIQKKLDIVPWMKEAFTRQKFRWKTMKNDKEGKRSTVFGLARPADITFENPRQIDPKKEPITVKSSTVLVVDESGNKGNENQEYADFPDIGNRCCLIKTLHEYFDTSKVEMSKMNQGSEVLAQREINTNLEQMEKAEVSSYIQFFRLLPFQQ